MSTVLRIASVGLVFGAIYGSVLDRRNEEKIIKELCFNHVKFSPECMSTLSATALESESMLKGMALAKAGKKAPKHDAEARSAHELYKEALNSGSKDKLEIENDEFEARLQRIVKRLLEIEDGSELVWSELEYAVDSSKVKDVPNSFEDALSFVQQIMPLQLVELAKHADEQVFRGLLVSAKFPPYKYEDLSEEGRLTKLVFDAMLNHKGEGKIMDVEISGIGKLSKVKNMGPALLRMAFKAALNPLEYIDIPIRVKLLATVIKEIIELKASNLKRHQHGIKSTKSTPDEHKVKSALPTTLETVNQKKKPKPPTMLKASTSPHLPRFTRRKSSSLDEEKSVKIVDNSDLKTKSNVKYEKESANVLRRSKIKSQPVQKLASEMMAEQIEKELRGDSVPKMEQSFQVSTRNEKRPSSIVAEKIWAELESDSSK